MQRPRREYGSGSISKRKDGTWTARLCIGKNANGKPKIKAFYTRDEALALCRTAVSTSIASRYAGVCSTEFEVKAAGTNDTGAAASPQTGDNSNILLWLTVLFVSGAGLFGTTVFFRKKKRME